MSKLKKRMILYFLWLFCPLVIGCSTHQAVKSLSIEQVKAQEQYLSSLRDYFSVIEKYVEHQIKLTESSIEAVTEEMNETYKKSAIRGIGKIDQNATIETKKKLTNEELDKLTKNVLDAYKFDQKGIAQVKSIISDLKQKHKSMLEAYETILKAQEKLNEYIQLEKADEVVVNQLLGTVGVEREKVSGLVTSVTNIYKEIEKFTEGGEKQ